MMSCKSVMNPLRIIALALVLSLCLNLLSFGCAVAENAGMKSDIAANTGWNIDELKPVNLSTEKDGIRFEVISGLVKEDSAAFLCSLEDPEGKYEGSVFYPSISDSFVTSDGYAISPYQDKAHHKTTYFYIPTPAGSLKKADTTLTLTACPIRIVHEPEFLIDLTPYLKQYGETTEGVTPPGKLLELGTPVFLDSQADIKVLDYTRSLDIPLMDNVFLSNIGWIDGRLHVQFHTTLPGCFTKDGVMYCSWSSWVFGNASLAETSHFSWDDNNDNWPEWSEFIFDCTPDQADKLELYAEVSTLDDVLPEGLEVTFPLSAVWDGSEGTPAETTP